MASLIARHRAQLLVALVAFLFGLWFIDPVNVWPTSIDWLSSGDMATGQNAWEYFRRTPLLQWPITSVRPYGEDWGTIFPSTQGNVLMGLPFKLLSSLLPGQFQYQGLWALSAFVLQGFFAERLFANFGLREYERVLGAVSMLIAPAFLFRIGMTHLDLSAHWLVIAALVLYFSDRKKRLSWNWLLIITVTMMVQIYLSVIVFAIAVASAVRRYLVDNAQSAHRKLVGELVLLTLTAFSVWYLLGYSTFLGSAQGEGFFRLNTLAFFNPGFGPRTSYSLLLDQVPSLSARSFFAEEGEGFAYLGLLGLAGCVALLLGSRDWVHVIRRRENIPIACIAAVLFAVAVSHRVAIIRREFELPVPQLLIDARQVFRVANRFSWLAYYLLLLAGWVAVVRLAQKSRFSKLLLTGLLLFAVVDQSRGIFFSRNQLVHSDPGARVLDSPTWDALGQQLSRMYLVPTFDVQSDDLSPGAEVWLRNDLWTDLIAFGARHNLTTNFAYVSRPVTNQVKKANDGIRRQLRTGQIPQGSIIFFANEREWSEAQVQVGGSAEALIVDNLYVLVAREAND